MTKVDDVHYALRRVVNLGHAGDRIGSERELSSFYNVDRSTVRTALTELVAAGLLTKSHRRGYYVAESPITTAVVEASGTDRHREREQPSHYVVTLYAGRPVACTCRSWVYRAPENTAYQCKHMKAQERK